ncbi:hypothetical protein ACJRO7_024210 [Eucalyptus globulus]|uniref:Myb-like domain-containing protein n=1 Tax=Eucalyptus globulus TaxID=34317 RepID=A0ABD3K519_EUCGL
MPGARMGGKKEKRGRREEDRVGVAMGVDGREVDAGDAVENGVDKVDRDEKKGKTKREVLGDGSEFVAENGKGSVGDKNEGARSEKKKKKRKQEVGRDKKELEKAVKKGSTLSEGNESGGGKSVSEVPQIVEDGDGHMHDGDFENKKERLQIQTKKKKNRKHQDFKKMDDVDKHFVDDRHEAGVQEQNKSLGKNIEEIKDTDEGGIKKKKKKKGRRDSDPVGDNQKKEEASRSSDAEIAKKDIREKERSKRQKQKCIEEQVDEAGVLEQNKSLGKNIEEIKDTDEGGIKKKKKKKGRRDSDPVGDNQKKEEASRSSDAEIAKKDVREKERSKRQKQKCIEEQVDEAGVQEQNKSLGKNIEEIKDTDEGGIKKKKKKKGRRDSDPVGDNQKKEEASRSSDAEIAKKDVREKERSKRQKQKCIEEQVDEAGVQEQNKSLGKNIEEIKDTDEGGIKKKKKKKGRRDSDPVGDNQKKEEASRSSDAEIAKKDHGMVLDNIAWGAISDSLVSRNCAHCCVKWYRQLTSPVVAEGTWADTDDYRLLNALVDLDACSIEDVDWDKLIENRSGDLCQKRWNQMVKHIGSYWSKSFPEQVEILSERYCPDLLEAKGDLR